MDFASIWAYLPWRRWREWVDHVVSKNSPRRTGPAPGNRTMTTKAAAIATAAWLLLVLGLGLLAVWYMGEHPVRGLGLERRAEMLGSGLGTVAAIGLGGIWGIWLLRRSPRRRDRPRP